MSFIYRKVESDDMYNDTKRCNIKINDSHIYDDINNINKNQQKVRANNKNFTNINSLNLKILGISFILLSSLLLGISLFSNFANITKFGILLNIICIIIIPLLIILFLSRYFINNYYSSQYNKKYNAMIENDKQELLELLNDYVVDASTNTVMKNYQLINLNKSTKEKINLDITNDYHFTNEVVSYIKKLEKTERDAIERQASKIPDFSEEDLQRCLKMISSLDNIREQKKVVKYNKKYSINSDIYKQKLNDYNEIIDNLTRESEELSHKINKLNA